MRGVDGKVLYIGKAANLRSRVRSYFTQAGDARFNVRFLMRHVRGVETVVTANEKEAFLLENTLIKKEQPRYNIRLRDDKSYVSVKINLRNEWPRAVVARRRNEREDGSLYLGPYASAGSVRETLRQLQRVFPIRSCSDNVLRNRTRPCILHSIGRCCAPCVKPVSRDEYAEMIQGTIMVLKGKTREVLEKLREKMEGHAGAMEYERAGVIRDRIAAIERTAERQLVHQHDGQDRDVIVFERMGGRIAFTVFTYRNGLLISSRPYILADHERNGPEMMREFLARYYETETPPGEILTDPPPEDDAVLSEWLGERREGKCEIHLPQRGEKLRLIEMAHENCRLALEQHLSGRKSFEEIQSEIMDRLKLESAPDPIECYDISTIQGYATVGSMVVFSQDQPDKSRYRRFRIKGIEGQDDFGSLREMLTRRFRRAIEEEEALPGLVLIDGGKGQLNVARAVFEELGIINVGLASIAKSRVKRRGDKVERTEERFFIPGRKNPIVFPAHSPALYLLQQARDEAHRFGITFHRKLRTKRDLRSSLEDLSGVGKARAKVLLKAFGSLRGLASATEEQIISTAQVPASVAQVVCEFVKGTGTSTDAQGRTRRD